MAIIVPEENHIGIAGLTDARFKAADYGGSGLEALGSGLAKFGEGGQQLATALDEKRRRELAIAAQLDDDHQRNIDDAAVKKAYVGHSDQAASVLQGVNGLLSQRGAQAHAMFPEVVQRLADSHNQALAPLTDEQRGIVAPILADRLRTDLAVAGAHVHAQGAAEQRLQNARLQQAAARDAVANVADPDLHDHHMATGEKAILQQAKIDDLPDGEVDGQLADYRSGVYAASIAVLAARAPRQAADWYARFGGALNAPDRRRVEAALIDSSVAASPMAETEGADAPDQAGSPPAISLAASDDPGLPGVENIAGALRGTPGQPRPAPSPDAGETSAQEAAPPTPAPAVPQAIPVPDGKFARNWPLLTPGQPDVATGNATRGPNTKRYADGWYDPQHLRADDHGIKYRLKAHYGVDFKSAIGSNVYAAAAGRVMTTGYDPKGWGYYVAVASPDGYVELYGHLSPTKFAAFARNRDVAQGQILGTVGNTGNASDKGDHLHFEVRRSNGSATLAHGSKYQGSTVDPLAWLRGELPDTRSVGLGEAPYLTLAAPPVARRRKAADASGRPASRHPPSRS